MIAHLPAPNPHHQPPPPPSQSPLSHSHLQDHNHNHHLYHHHHSSHHHPHHNHPSTSTTNSTTSTTDTNTSASNTTSTSTTLPSSSSAAGAGSSPPPHPNSNPNGDSAPPPPPSTHEPAHRQPRQEKVRMDMVGVPAMTPDGVVLVDQPLTNSIRSYTPLKVVGDGSFGTVWLCDWHSTLPPNTPLSPMQCGAGARVRPEWSGKRLVAVKRMKKRWEGGWEECRQLKELESLRLIAQHPNIIPLYDYFLLPATKELYFVFECMEGNLYQLIKSRKGKPLAGGLVASIFRQVVTGLHHIHSSGYFHRDMKPENLLVTTTGLQDYAPTSPLAPPNAPPDKDVTVIVKLADFGLARETKSLPPYTEYVSTRWYRAPEVLLHFRDYSNPVDMWAFGTILAELVNLKPLFPGQQELDQVARICEVLGDPSDAYGFDERKRLSGGGKWSKGVKMAKARGFLFPQITPVPFKSLFEPSVPQTLIDCIDDLLKYDPEVRLTSAQCLNHPYLLETSSKTVPPRIHTSSLGSSRSSSRHHSSSNHSSHAHGLPSVSPRAVPPSHAHSPHAAFPPHGGLSVHHVPPNPQAHPHSSHHTRQPPVVIPGYPTSHSNPSLHRLPSHLTSPSSDTPPVPSLPNHLTNANGHLGHHHGHGGGHLNGAGPGGFNHADPGRDLFQQLRREVPKADLASFDGEAPASPLASSVYSYNGEQWQSDGPDLMYNQARYQGGDDRQNAEDRMDISKPDPAPTQQPAQQKHGVFGFKPKGWFGGKRGTNQPVLPPVEEMTIPSSSSTPSLKRTQSGSTSDSRSLSEFSPVSPPPPVIITTPAPDAKKAKKEEEKAAKDAEMARRAMKLQLQREKARAVMSKREHLLNPKQDIWSSSHTRAFASNGPPPTDKGKQSITGASQGGHHSQTPQSELMASSSSKDTLMRNAAPLAGSVPSSHSHPSHSHSHSKEEVGHRHRISIEDPQRNKARRRDLDDDHSMSSSDFRSQSRLSLATVDSDPGPHRSRHRGANTNSSYSVISRATSVSSLRTSYSAQRGFSPSARSSASLEQGFITDFNENISMGGPSGTNGHSPGGPGSDIGSPSLQRLSLHTAGHQSPPWVPAGSPPPPIQGDNLLARRLAHSAFTSTLPPIAAAVTPPAQYLQLGSPNSPFDTIQRLPTGQSSPGLGPQSAIIPMFQVPPLPPESIPSSQNTATHDRLPPFSHLASVADGASEGR